MTLKKMCMVLFFIVNAESKLQASCCQDDTVKKFPTKKNNTKMIVPTKQGRLDFTQQYAILSRPGSGCCGGDTIEEQKAKECARASMILGLVQHGEITMA